MANSHRRVITFSGMVQCLYTLFSSSTECWDILKEHIGKNTLKSLSATRWESRVDSVKATRYQAPQVRDALVSMAEAFDVQR